MKRLAGIVGSFVALLCWSGAARAAVIACGTTEGPQGGRATIQITLEVEGDEIVAGAQNDLEFDPAVFGIDPDNCAINPAIGPDTAADKRLNTSLPLGTTGLLRNLVVALDNSNPIPSGALYTCAFDIQPTAPVGEYTLVTTNAIASNPDGDRYPTTTGNCTIMVREAPTPTPTPECDTDEDCPSGEVCVDGTCVTATPTRTPIGYCTDDEDCPEGQVCVDNMCVTPTPTRTPIGYCTGDEDCPEGQVCIDNMCVAVTPTRKKSGGGGGCSCEIDPGAGGRSGDALAVLLPALLLALRWRRRTR